MFVELATGTDLRPAIIESIQSWVARQVKAVVAFPNAVIISRVRGNLDVEITIEVAPTDRKRITERLCLRLADEIGREIKAVPCVYLKDAPHPAAREALHYAQCQA